MMLRTSYTKPKFVLPSFIFIKKKQLLSQLRRVQINILRKINSSQETGDKFNPSVIATEFILYRYDYLIKLYSV